MRDAVSYLVRGGKVLALIETLKGVLATDYGRWQEAKEAAKSGPNVLIPTNVSALSHASMLEGLLGIALTLRGANVHYLVCDEVMPACQFAGKYNVDSPSIFENYQLPETICNACEISRKHFYDPLGLKVHRYSSLLTLSELRHAKEIAESVPLEEISSFTHAGMVIGDHAKAGALRYFARGDLEGVEGGEVVLRRYLEASMQTLHAVNRLTKGIEFESSVFHHGIYVPQGIVGEVLRKRDIPVVNWNPSYRRSTFIFSHGDSYHHTMMTEPTDVWTDMKWNGDNEKEILDYLKSRWFGSRDWIWFHEQPDEDVEKFAMEAGLDMDKPIIGMLTNVIWDAQLHFPTNAFPTMLEWVLETIRYFKSRPDIQLLLRVHPAEIRGTVPSSQPIMDEIAAEFPELPSNVFIITPESATSTYAAMEMCDSVLIFGTKTGVELAAQSIPVVVGGEAWIRNKGLTQDASSKDEYFQHLDNLPFGERMDEESTLKARKYAYHFFFRRMIPVPYLQPKEGKIYKLGLKSLGELEAGVSAGLDVICDGILKRTPFIYKAEEIGLGENAD